MRFKNSQRYYLVKWLGYSNRHNTWEPRVNFSPSCFDLLKKFDDMVDVKVDVEDEWSKMDAEVNETIVNMFFEGAEEFVWENNDMTAQRIPSGSRF